MFKEGYYWVNDLKLVAKIENHKAFLYKNGTWEFDTRHIVKDRLIGYDPDEGIGCTDMLNSIDEISPEEAIERMTGIFCDKKEILLNRMYSGNFLTTGDNIGHEVINLFRDDQGRNYIYVLADGSIAKEHNGNVQIIYLVRWIGNSTMEILAKAEYLKQIIYRKGAGKSERQELHEKQIAYISENDIRYGGVRLDKLYEGNIYQGKIEEDALYVTYEAMKVRKPSEPIYITDRKSDQSDEKMFYLEGINFSKQSPRMYYAEGTSAYKELDRIARDESLWEETNTTEEIQAEKYDEEEQINFLKVIRKEYDEIVFSNLLQHYFLRNKNVFQRFCQEVLCGIEMEESYTVIRETEENIDLLIRDSGNIIVIENKIKSGINGIQQKEKGESVSTQLSKYYEHAVKLSGGKKKVSCFIFSPDYNRLDIRNFQSAEHYTIIPYSRIYEFFRRYKEEFQEDKYFEDFLSGLHKHTHKVDNEMYEEMRRKFSRKILEMKKERKTEYL